MSTAVNGNVPSVFFVSTDHYKIDWQMTLLQPLCSSMERSLAHVVIGFAVLSLSACGLGDWRDTLPPPIDRDLDEIVERDTLHVLATYNSTSYFLYRGQPMGYEYELLEAFAEDKDLELRMHVLPTRNKIYRKLLTGEGDLIASRVVPMGVDSTRIAYTARLYRTRPAVVQPQVGVPQDSVLPESVDTVVNQTIQKDERSPVADMAVADSASRDTSYDSTVEVDARLVQRPSELAGKRVTLPFHSEYTGLLAELSDSLTGDIHVVELDTVGAHETIIRRIASRDLQYTVSPRHLAKLSESYFTNIRIRPTVGPSHEVAWAVRKNATNLKAALDEWINEHRDGPLFNQLFQKYFVDRRGYQMRAESDYLSSETGRLSQYDPLFRKHADTLGWDWRLLAAQAYQESKFDADARSWAGAAGLLQLMPATAREYGVTDVYSPQQNVAGAVRFISWLTDYWKDKIADKQMRRKFILASYNAGHGHVEDARRLTRKHGDNPNVWPDVAYWLLQLAKRNVYEDPVVKYGFCRGLEPVRYVSYILDRYDHYQEMVVTEPEDATAQASL